MCNCGTEIETSKHFFLRCQFFASERHNLHNELCLIDSPVISFAEESLLNCSIIWYDDEFNDKLSKGILLYYTKSSIYV